MKLTWHIAKKDFLRLWPLLALWWGVLVLRGLLPALDLTQSFGSIQFAERFEPAWESAMRYHDIRLFAFKIADAGLLLLLAAAVIRTDSPLRAFAHWRVLPLRGGRVVRAKLLFFVLFCGLPAALIHLGAKIAYGFPAAAWIAGLAWLEWKITAALAAGALLAVLFRRPLITPVVLLLFFAFSFILFDVPDRWPGWLWPNGSSLFWPDGTTLYLSCYLIWWGLLLATALGAIVCVYRGRRRWPAVLLVIAGFICANAAQAWWFYDFMAASSSTSIMPAPQPEPAFSLEITGSLWSTSNKKDSPLNMAHLSAAISGLHARQPGEAWLPLASNWTLQWPDGHSVSSPARNPDDPAHFEHIATGPRGEGAPVNFAELLPPLGLDPLLKNRYVHLSHWTSRQLVADNRLSTVEDDFTLDAIAENGTHYDRAFQGPFNLRGEIDFAVGPLTRVGDVPATEGAQFPRTPDYFAISKIELVPSNYYNLMAKLEKKPAERTPVIARIDLVTQSLVPTGVTAFGTDNLSDDANGSTYFFVLWNAKRHEVLPAERVQLSHESDFNKDDADGLTIYTGATSLFFQIYKSADAAQLPPQAVQQWLADARLVEFSFTPQHIYYVPTKLDNLDIPLTPAPVAPKPPTP